MTSSSFKSSKVGMTAIAFKIRQNFMMRMEEVSEVKYLMQLAKEQKHSLLKNIYYNGQNLIRNEKEREPIEETYKRYEQSLDEKFTKVIDEKFAILESKMTSQISNEIQKLKDYLNGN